VKKYKAFDSSVGRAVDCSCSNAKNSDP